MRRCDADGCSDRGTIAEAWRAGPTLTAIVWFCPEHHDQSVDAALEASRG